MRAAASMPWDESGSMRTRSIASGTPWLAQKRSKNLAHVSALGESPWCTCSAVSLRPDLSASSASRCSRTLESSPPENPTQTGASAGISARRSGKSSMRCRAPLFRQLLELAIVDPALLAALEQLLGREVLQPAQALLDRLLQALRPFRGIAMPAAERLVDHLCGHAERLQARRGDREALGRPPRVVGALPEDRGAPPRGDHRVGRGLHHEGHVAPGHPQRAPP